MNNALAHILKNSPQIQLHHDAAHQLGGADEAAAGGASGGPAVNLDLERGRLVGQLLQVRLAEGETGVDFAVDGVGVGGERGDVGEMSGEALEFEFGVVGGGGEVGFLRECEGQVGDENPDERAGIHGAGGGLNGTKRKERILYIWEWGMGDGGWG